MKTGNLFGLLAILFVLSVGAASAQTTEFTYQGRLTDGGMPPTASYDFEFRLYDENNALLGTVNRLGVAVTSGAFTVGLDFGAQFPGAARSLEIAVKPAGGGAYTTLSPRQPITSAPYSIRSLTADIAENSNQLGGIPSAQFVQTDAGGNASIGGNLSVGGTLTQSIVNATTEYRINNQRILSVEGTNNTFVGIFAGAANTTGEGNSFFGISAGRVNSTGNGNSYFGAFAGRTNSTGFQNSFFGNRAGEQNTEGSSNSFFGLSAGRENTSGGSNSFFGASAGSDNTIGERNVFFGTSAGRLNTTGSNNSFFGMFSGDKNLTGGNNTIIGFNADVGANNLNFASAFGAGSIVNANNTIVLGRNLDTVQIPGNLSLAGNFTGSFIIPVSNGGTNLSSSGAAGNFLRSDGATWTSSPILAADLPNLGGSFIQNSTNQQTSANFNIDGDGTLDNLQVNSELTTDGLTVTSDALIGGELTVSNLTVSGDGYFGGIVNADSRYELNGQRFISTPATSNFFAGINTGPSDTPGLRNTYLGNQTAPVNTNRNDNVFIGYNVGRLASQVDQSVFIGNKTGDVAANGGNTFIGYGAGLVTTTGVGNTFVGLLSGGNIVFGNNNTALGANTDFGNVSFGTAVGSGASVYTFNTIALGRANGLDKVRIFGLGTNGTTPLCRNVDNEISTCTAPITESNNAALNEEIKNQQTQNQKQAEQIQSQQKLLDAQQKQIDALKKLVCQTNQQAEVCRETNK